MSRTLSPPVVSVKLDKRVPERTTHVVLDSHDRIVSVGREIRELMGPFIGHVFWDRLPCAEPLLRPGFDQARTTGLPVQFTVYYAGRVRSYEAVPAGERLAVRIEHLAELDVTTLATLARSLSQIEAELAVREPGRRDRPAPSSPQALP